MLLPLLDKAFFVFHALLIAFNMVGWAWKKTRAAHLIVLGLTAFSWIVMGAFHGWGDCLCTDWHFRVRHHLGYVVWESFFCDRGGRRRGRLNPNITAGADHDEGGNGRFGKGSSSPSIAFLNLLDRLGGRIQGDHGVVDRLGRVRALSERICLQVLRPDLGSHRSLQAVTICVTRSSGAVGSLMRSVSSRTDQFGQYPDSRRES